MSSLLVTHCVIAVLTSKMFLSDVPGYFPGRRVPLLKVAIGYMII